MSEASLHDVLGRRSSLFSISRPEISATSQIDASDAPDHEVRLIL